MASKITDIRKELKSFVDPRKAKVLQSFFKTGAGEYGEGDLFYGIGVPKTRKIARAKMPKRKIFPFTGYSPLKIKSLYYLKLVYSQGLSPN